MECAARSRHCVWSATTVAGPGACRGQSVAQLEPGGYGQRVAHVPIPASGRTSGAAWPLECICRRPWLATPTECLAVCDAGAGGDPAPWLVARLACPSACVSAPALVYVATCRSHLARAVDAETDTAHAHRRRCRYNAARLAPHSTAAASGTGPGVAVAVARLVYPSDLGAPCALHTSCPADGRGSTVVSREG